MKIRRDIVGGKDVLITPCSQCVFYSNRTCDLGRLEKYDEKEMVVDDEYGEKEVLTFCNHARPSEWAADLESHEMVNKVGDETKISYDLVVRLTSADQIPLIKPLLNDKVQKIIYSFIDVKIKDAIEQAMSLDHAFELLKIEDIEDRDESEYNRVSQVWYQTVDLDLPFDTTLVEQLEVLINNDLEQIAGVFGDQSMVMTGLPISLKLNGLKVCQENMIELAEQQEQLQHIRRFDGSRICDYS
jgi:hypothetical protein